MSRTNRFARELYKSLNQKRTGYEWEIGVPPCENRECVDVIGENGNKCVLVEVELRGTAPVVNVVKIWKWLGKRQAYVGKQILLIQAFSKFYKSQPSFQRDNAIYLGDELQRRFKNLKYRPVDFPFRPMKKRASANVAQGGGAMRTAARKLAQRVARLL